MRARFAALLLVVLCAGCGRGFDAPAPERTPPAKAPQPPRSTIAATFSIPLADVLKQLDEKTKPGLAHIKGKRVPCPLGKCKLDLEAVRAGAFGGAASGGRLTLSLPFAVSAHLDYKSKLLKTGADSNARGVATAQSSLRLKPDWKLETTTQGAVRLEHGDLRVGPLALDLTDLWNQNAEHLSAPLFKALDRRVASAVKVKPQAQRLWEKAFLPFKVGKKPEAWLLIAPEHLRASPLRIEGGRLEVTLAVDGHARVVVGPKPDSVKPAKIPNLLPLTAPSNAFAFAVPALLPYEEASRLALARLRQHPPHVGATAVTFEQLEILPSRDDVVLRARFCISNRWDIFGWFDSCGAGYLRGAPVYDAAARKIRVINVRYDIQTAELVLSAMRALAGPALGQALEKDLVFDAGHEIDKLKVSIRAALKKPQARGVRIVGAVEQFGDPRLVWTDKGFLATLTATGTIHADLNIQPPKPRKPKATKTRGI